MFEVKVANGLKREDTQYQCPDQYVQNTEELVVKHDDVRKLICEINVNKPSGILNITSQVLKDALSCLTNQITHLFKVSFSESIFPKSWKKGTITPLPKPGDSSKVTNLRPISILPIVGKLQEKLAHRYLYEYLEENDLLTTVQYGYRKELSTGEAVFDVVNDMFKFRDMGQATVATFIDMKKAFDSVHHGILLKKLSTLGLHKKFLDWVQSYLSDREQRTKVLSTISESKPVKFGVPQGSVLGPLLFIYFINDLPSVVKHAKIIMYTDDIVLYCSNINPRIAVHCMQLDLNSISKWCNQISMTINENKTQAMWFASTNLRKTLQDLTLRINGKVLKEVQQYQYLGVQLDTDLNLVKYVNTAVSKMSNRVFKLGRLRISINQLAAILVYKQTVLPVADYGSFLAESARRDPTQRFQVIQNQALRICLKVRMRDMSVEELHCRTEVPILFKRRKELLVTMMFRKKEKSVSSCQDKKYPVRQKVCVPYT